MRDNKKLDLSKEEILELEKLAEKIEKEQEAENYITEAVSFQAEAIDSKELATTPADYSEMFRLKCNSKNDMPSENYKTIKYVLTYLALVDATSKNKLLKN